MRAFSLHSSKRYCLFWQVWVQTASFCLGTCCLHPLHRNLWEGTTTRSGFPAAWHTTSTLCCPRLSHTTTGRTQGDTTLTNRCRRWLARSGDIPSKGSTLQLAALYHELQQILRLGQRFSGHLYYCDNPVCFPGAPL